ncbi:MAG: response regulator, partial [Calditrichia bacterium]|nr:response regulator [Calditrichia bacterium]
MENKVLVVDNEKKMCHIISIALEMENIEVEYVFSGKDALQKLRENKFDVVISDLKMAPMDGLTLLKEVKIHFPSVEVLMMTAYASQ